MPPTQQFTPVNRLLHSWRGTSVLDAFTSAFRPNAFLAVRSPHRRYCSVGATEAPAEGAVYKTRKCFSPEEVLTFLKLTGDSNPLHTNKTAAEAAGLPGMVLPGILMASLFPAIIGSRFPGALYLTQSLNFRAPALVGDTVEAEVCVAKCKGSKILFNTAVKSEGGKVLVDGTALALIQEHRSP